VTGFLNVGTTRHPDILSQVVFIVQDTLRDLFSTTADNEFMNESDPVDTMDLNLIMGLLNYMYALKNAGEIRCTIEKHNYLTSLLDDAYEDIRKEFPCEKISLEIYSDPAYPTEKEVLISILTSMSPDEAINRLDRVDDDWWINNLGEPYINTCLKLEYQ
jgi:hypothetical protein